MGFFQPSATSAFVIFLALFHIAHGYSERVEYTKAVIFDLGTCNPTAHGLDGNVVDQRLNLQSAFKDANTIAHAGIIAAARPDEPPFNYYFHPTTNETVVHNLRMVTALTEDPDSFSSGLFQGRVVMNCNDRRWCKLDNQWGYPQVRTYYRNNFWEITICDFGLNVPQRNPAACTGSVGLPSLGWVALKYLIQMWDIRVKTGMVGNYAFGPADCHALVSEINRGAATTNAENYAYMSSSAYDLGLKGDGPYYGNPCPERWNPDSQIILPPWAASGITDRHTGLD